MTAYRVASGRDAAERFPIARRKPLRAFPMVFGGAGVVGGFAAVLTIAELASPTGTSILVPVGIGALGAAAVAAVAARNLRRTTCEATSDALLFRVPEWFGFRAREHRIPWVALTRATADYPRDRPVLRLRFSGREIAVPTGAFTSRPEVVASRIRRFRAYGAAGLRASDAEIDAHASRFAEPRDLSIDDPWSETAALRCEFDGLRYGLTSRDEHRVPWADVSCAHVVTRVPGLDDVVQVELADGNVLDVRIRPGIGREDLASLLAPRFIGGDQKERSLLDAPEPDDRPYFEAPDVVAKHSKNANKKRRRAVAASDPD